MATKEILRDRSRIAARFSMTMRDPEFFAKAEKVIPKDSDGEYTVIIAAAYESAAITIHRMEQVGQMRATLVTEIDDRLNITSFSGHRVQETGIEHIDVPGGLTVQEWLEMARQPIKRAFGANGSEFAAELTSLSLTNA